MYYFFLTKSKDRKDYSFDSSKCYRTYFHLIFISPKFTNINVGCFCVSKSAQTFLLPLPWLILYISCLSGSGFFFFFSFSLSNILWCSGFQHPLISGKHFPLLVWRHLFYLDFTSSQLTLPLGRCPEGQLFSQFQFLASETHTQATFGPSQDCHDLLVQLWYAMLWVQIKWVWVSRHSNLRILKKKNPQWYL